MKGTDFLSTKELDVLNFKLVYKRLRIKLHSLAFPFTKFHHFYLILRNLFINNTE